MTKVFPITPTDSVEISKQLVVQTYGKPDRSWRTSHEWAADWCLSHSRAMAKLALEVAAGITERKVFQIHNGLRPFPTPHYRRKDAK